jgi:hypothetical protein
MGDADGVERAFELAFPIAEKALQRRKVWGEIVFLPDEEL